MFRTYHQHGSVIADRSQVLKEQTPARSGWCWCSLGAVLGLSGGLLSALIGSLLTAISWLTATENGHSLLRMCGTILLFMTIPLLILGAHCLDLKELRGRRAK